MRRRWEVVCWLMWFLFAGALPAYANNPPAPDGMFSLILIFPVVIVGWRWAGVKLTEREEMENRQPGGFDALRSRFRSGCGRGCSWPGRASLLSRLRYRPRS